MTPLIAGGQTWRDKDKRREQDGRVRTFVVRDVELEHFVWCEKVPGGEKFYFNRKRFGSGRANDSFELVSEPATATIIKRGDDAQ